MSKLFPLVLYYIFYYKGKTVILSFCLTAALTLPVTAHLLVSLLQTEMGQRAKTTPLVIGPEGSRFDLVLHALYFNTEALGTLPQGERFLIEETGHATAIPLLHRFQARGYPIVGTTLEYFSFRGISVAEGRSLTRLGDCVVGWQVARDLNLKPGDRLLSDPENVFDLGGAYPLDMRVSGILERSRSPDDRAVFVDVRTAWIIEGMGHGHEELSNEENVDSVLARGESHIIASPAVRTHTRITPENLASFHFHGDPATYPLTAIITIPVDRRGETLLLGRYAGDHSPHQAIRPKAVIDEMMGMVIQLKRFFDLHHLLLLGITILFVILVMALSLRLRRQEMETMFHLGCSRSTIFSLLAMELLILLAVSALLAGAISWISLEIARGWIQTLTG